ncbi:DUF2069 domain-containing protein [Thalassolituus sp.]|uniref:DUF2069 domain-containing protein n=1 Tax=Thalassolituus sp. TaxID=2030822 RepID=UPI002A7FC07D|nr:DUF2069 domain-containing protein [Thalassolituus sp.]|tara:strand:- start:1390 stop:1779 length:390 start_codon:yes stop_codon:yes gene_type:complete
MKLTRVYQLMLASYLGTLLVLLAYTFRSPPQTFDSTAVLYATGTLYWSLRSLPLLLFIPGLLKKSHKAASWLAYVIMLYFVFAITVLFTQGTELWGWLLIAMTLTVFVTTLLFTRWQKAALRLQAEQNS